jgi:hypothetical protein
MALITQRETAFRKALENPDSFATVLLALLIDEYSTDIFEWEPQALTMQIKDDFHLDLPQKNSDKIWALIVSMTTNQFFQNPEIFLNVCKTLAHGEADFAIFRPVTPEEMSWGVTEVVVNNPPAKEMGNTEFSDEVSSMVGMLLDQQGLLKPPNALQFAIYPTENPVLDLETMFADDEDMLQAALSNQTKIAQEVDDHTKELFKTLKQQLDDLPLSSRVTK